MSSGASPTLPPGLAARFTPERLLGKGAFGSVWLARQVGLDRRVALKVLHNEVLQSEAEVGRFLDEAKITAALAHPNIVVVLDHGVDDGVPWIAYELLEGRSLRDRIAGEGMPWRDAVAALAQVADALVEAHRRGVLHRDLKPDNIIEVEPGRFKVADFGLAKWTHTQRTWTQTGAVVGSPAYLSPEQIEGFEPGPASEVYALGITLYEILTGALPFVDTEGMPVMLHHLKTPAPRPGDAKPMLPRVMDVLVARALEKRPEDRFGSARELKEALEAVLRGESSAVLVRMRARGGRSRSEGNERPAPGTRPGAPGDAAPGGGRRVLLAAALTLPTLVALALAVKVRAPPPPPPPPPSAAAAPMVTPKRLVVVPQPPHAVRVEYELDRLPPEGWPLAIEVDGHARAPLKLTSVEGSALVTGLAPGAKVKIAGARELAMPRGLVALFDVVASDRHATLSVRTLEPAALELTVLEHPTGRQVHSGKTERSHHFSTLVKGLRPTTRYAVRMRALDADRYLAPDVAEWHFITGSVEHSDSIRKELKQLATTSPPDRLRAAGFVTFVPDPELLPVAAAVLHDPRLFEDPETAGQLMHAVARIRDPRALPAFRAALRSARTPLDRIFVIARIGEVQDPQGFDDIVSAVRTGAVPEEEEAVRALAHALIACEPGRARALFDEVAREPATGPSPFTLRAAAAWGLAVLGGDAAAAALERMARAAPKRALPLVAAALGVVGGAGARAELVGIVSAGGRGDPATLESALRALARVGAPEDAPAVIAVLGAPAGARIKRAAIAALAGIGGDAATAELAKRVADPDPGVALASAWAAGQLKIAAAAPALLKRLGDPASSAGRVPRALGVLGDPAAVEPLLALLARPVAAGPQAGAARLDRAEALWALGMLREPRAVTHAIDALSGADVYTRFRAVEALGLVGAAEARPRLEALLKQEGIEAAVREAAQRSLKWIVEGKRPRGRVFLVDPAFPAVRTGTPLALGDRFDVEAQGLCLTDPGAIQAKAPERGALPPGVRVAKVALVGLVGAEGQCAAGRGECADCTRASSGELALAIVKASAEEQPAGFVTAWVHP